MKSFTKRLCAIMVALVLSLSMMSTLVACGSLGLTSIVVVESSITTEYYVGDTVSFDGIKIKANYNDGSEEELKLSDVKVFLNDEDISSNLSKITETKGDKEVVISYQEQSASITIKVSEKTVTPGQGEPVGPLGKIMSYGLPESYSDYETKTKAAGTVAYGADGFEAQFTTGNEEAKDYLVGDDNVFKFLPLLIYRDYSNFDPANPTASLSEADAFASVTTIKVFDNDEGIELDSRTVADNTVEYYLDTTVYATAYTLKNEYQFTQNAIGKQFELSVDPVDGYFDWNIAKTSATAVVNVIDGYNVYEAYQLAVIDNSQSEWNDIKTAKKDLENINPNAINAIIFQNDITVTTKDIPAAFTYTLDQEVKYIDRNGDTVIGSSTFLYDGKDIIRRTIYDGTNLAIYGNYHTLDLQQLPLVSSFTNKYEDDAYGPDGSNTTFFAFRGYYTNSANFGAVSFNNLALSGNANVDPLKNHPDNGPVADEADNPVYCGGIIFSKTSYIGATYSNVNVHKTFIPFFPDDVDYHTDQVQNYPVVIKDCKVYDSLNNAIFTYGRTKLDIINSVMERAAGPLILSQVSQPETYGALRAPIITVDDNSILNNLVTGGEFWFSMYGASSVISKLAPLDYIFSGFGHKIFYKENPNDINEKGKLNLIYAVMPSGGLTGIANWSTQGFFSYKGVALDRIYTDQTKHPFGAITAGILKEADEENDPNEEITLESLETRVIGMTFNAGSSFGFMANSTTPSFAVPGVGEIPTNDFLTSNYIALNYGGIGLFLEFFPA